MAEVQLTAAQNVLANEQQHTDQSKPSYDIYLLEKVDSNTTPDSTNMYHRGGESDQDAKQYKLKSPLLNAELVKSKEMIEKESIMNFHGRYEKLNKENEHFKTDLQRELYIAIGQRFSLNKSSAVHEKPNTPRSCLRWIPTGRIFKLVGLRWIPTGKMFIDNTSKVDSEPPNGSNEDITNPYECDQTLNVSVGLRHKLLSPRTISLGLVPQPPSPTPNVPPTKNEWDSLFCPMFDEYFNPSPSVIQHVLVAVVQEPVVSTSTPSSMRIDQDTPSTSASQTTQEEQSHVISTSVEEDDHEPSSEESSSRIVIPTYYDAFLSSSEHKSYKDALTKSCWIDAMKSSMSSSEGSGTTLEVPDEPKDNSDKQAGYVQTNLTLSSAELGIQSMVDVPIHLEDLVVQRTPLIDPVISMTFQEEFRSAGWCKENSDGQKTIAEDSSPGVGFMPHILDVKAGEVHP
ncbi:hypothetical protein Tco_0701023 [Tanacetum coccineum]